MMNNRCRIAALTFLVTFFLTSPVIAMGDENGKYIITYQHQQPPQNQQPCFYHLNQFTQPDYGQQQPQYQMQKSQHQFFQSGQGQQWHPNSYQYQQKGPQNFYHNQVIQNQQSMTVANENLWYLLEKFRTKRKPRRIDTKTFGKQTMIRKWHYPNEFEKENSRFEQNLPLSTFIFAGKNIDECKELIRNFKKNSSYLGTLKFVQKICKDIPLKLETSEQTYTLPATTSTEILSRWAIRGSWSLTPLDADGKTMYPDNLLKLMLYFMYNYKDIKDGGNISAYSQEENMIHILENIGFEKKEQTLLGKSHLKMNKYMFLQICNNPDLPLFY